jgi:phosphodiesterase/alkaline phosphatase D-like protein
MMIHIRRGLGIVPILALLSFSSGVIARGPVEWVWSGAVTESSAVVKAKVGRAGEPRLFVGESEISPREISAGGIATFQLDGLTPGTTYEYRVAVGEGAAIGGRFQTFVQGPSSFRFVFGSCARTGSNHRVFEAMESLGPLFTLHMGDFHYENIETNDPAEFRRAFDRVLASERQSSLYRSAPIAYIWDDHDYGPNDADGTHPGKPAAVATYGEYVPHYPLVRDEGLPRDLRQAFTVGRIRFLLTDVRSHRVPDGAPDGPEKTMLGVDQREWLLGEIEAARGRYALVVWVNPVPWIAEPGSGHGWGRYDWERRHIADRIFEAGMTGRLLMLSGDGHMVAIDDGTHSNFATNGAADEKGFPVMHAAPLDRYARPKGGPYSHGVAGRRILFGLIPIQQFGLAEIRDDGRILEVSLSGRNESGDLLRGMSLGLRCDDRGCRTGESFVD